MSSNQDILVRISDDKAVARICVPASFDVAHMSPELLAGYAERAGVGLNQLVRTRLAQVAEQFRANPAAMDIAFAQAVAPTHGVDGAIVWQPAFDPNAGEAKNPDAEGGAVDHYAGKHFVPVKQGDHVATLSMPTVGEDGVDVTGAVIKAKPGRPCPTRIDSTLLVDAQQRIIAQADGVLRQSPTSLGITNLLEVKGQVDFESGNIKFDGAVDIRGGICDKFVVEATGDITVGGLVESATVTCGGNLTCRRGVAARDVSMLDVKGNADIGFINNARGIVNGDLLVRREIINSDIAIGGNLRCEQGSVIGGTVRIGASATIATLGSDANRTTTVILGTMPVLEKQLREDQATIVRLTKQLRKSEEKLAQLQLYAQHASAKDREAMTELSFEVAEMNRELAETQSRQEEIRAQMAQSRTVSLNVLKLVHANVRFETEDLFIRMTREVKGPVHFGWNDRRELCYRLGNGETRPIQEIAETSGKGSRSMAA